ncbi:MAG TPA: MarR family transcriptional regulator [Clostridiales bacterium UBA8960]|nr:MarR family transcriptional regulator [Clostridiales bacterium UBA8960]
MDPFDRSYEVMKHIKKLKELMHENMSQTLNGVNLTGPQGMIVRLLFRFGPQKISDIKERMGLSMSTVSGILDRLERDNVISREKSETDKRVILIHLTEDFKKTSTKAFTQMEALWSDKLNRATDTEIKTILEALSILERLMSQKNDEGDTP